MSIRNSARRRLVFETYHTVDGLTIEVLVAVETEEPVPLTLAEFVREFANSGHNPPWHLQVLAEYFEELARNPEAVKRFGLSSPWR